MLGPTAEAVQSRFSSKRVFRERKLYSSPVTNDLVLRPTVKAVHSSFSSNTVFRVMKFYSSTATIDLLRAGFALTN